MKLTVIRENLLKPLQLISNVVERRQTTPILANVLLRVKANQLILIGTDLEVELQINLQVTSKEEGDITIPARKLLDLCRTLPDNAELEINSSMDKVVIRSGRSRFTLATMPAMEFPETEISPTKSQLNISQQDLKYLIEQTQFAMAQQDVRYYLNGLMLEVQADKITAVATDGHRLACCTHLGNTGIATPQQIIIPRKGVTELLRLLDSNTDNVTLQISGNQIRVELPDVTLTSKLIDGKFPDYHQVLPKNTTKEMQAKRLSLHQGFSRIAVLSNEKFRSMRLLFTNNLIRASVHNPEQEEAEEEIEVTYSGDELEIGFNISYFLEALAAIRQEDVVVHCTDANHSCLVHGYNDTTSQYVIMPMRL
jgi:DNA polymerase III subunit beta